MMTRKYFRWGYVLVVAAAALTLGVTQCQSQADSHGIKQATEAVTPTAAAGSNAPESALFGGR